MKISNDAEKGSQTSILFIFTHLTNQFQFHQLNNSEYS